MNISENDNTNMKFLIEEIREEICNDSNTRDTSEFKKSSLKLSNPFKSNKIHPNDISFDNSESENTKNYNFLNLSESKNIEQEIKEMRLELKKSLEFFTTTRDTLESISFENIKHHIKDLHLFPNDSDANKILEELQQKKEFDKNITKLTKIMSEKFKDHPGEFADIPEMSSFFKVCTQLQKGLDDLDKKRSNFNCLGKRIIWATNVSENRSKDIQKIMSDQERLSASVQGKLKE